MREWKYSSSILDLRSRGMCQLHAPAALPPGKEFLVSVGYVAGWASEAVVIYTIYFSI
jgi:hypothetical protein